MANRLSESNTTNVLLIEAGVSEINILDTVVPLYGLDGAFNKPWTWNYTVTPQAELNNRTFAYPRGKMIGGTTGINSLVFSLGGADDYNRWANVTGDQGWSWQEMIPYMRKTELFIPPPAPNTLKPTSPAQYIPSAHGTSGMVLTSLPGFPTEIDEKVANATTQVGFNLNEDMNRGDQIGVGWVYSAIGDGRRSSAATTYLNAHVIARPNLDVLVNTQATRLLSTGFKGKIPSFNKVEFAQSANGTKHTVTATKEVIVSGGSINTPQLLLLSGIGPSAQLKSVGITPLVNLPGVGQNLADHPLLPNQFYVNSTNTWEQSRDPAVAAAEFTQWQEGTGPLVNAICNHIGWLRIPENSSIWTDGGSRIADPSAGTTSAHYEFVFSNGFVGAIQAAPDTGNFMTVISNVVSPASRGSVTLASANPFDYPLIDPGYFKSKIDFLILREAVKEVRRFLSAPAFKNYIIAPYGPSNVTTDDEIDAFIMNFTTSVWHPVGTAAMGTADGGKGGMGVLDPSLSVRGVNGVRVVDASVMPFIPSAHTQAPVYAIAERAAALVKAAWKLN